MKKEITDRMQKNPDNWIGIFYFNRKDRRIIVPKITPLTGWTFNFASPYAYLLIAGLTAAIILASYYL
jgi:uncharacterized membrane protein